jgi:uncharacterized protein (TIGR01244 family)
VIPDYSRPRPGLACAGQPSAEGIQRLSELGFRTVINLRTEAEPGVPEAAAAVQAQQLRYVSVPVRPDSFSSDDVDAVAAVLEDPDAGPVLLHCGSSNRVGGVIAVLAWRDGRTPEQALEEGRAAGLRSDSMVAAVERVIAEESTRR